MRPGIGLIIALSVLIMTAVIVLTASAASVSADAGPEAANISWMLVCTAMVFLMSPAVALFYGGMLRKQSMTATMTQTLIAMQVMGIMWVLIGFSLAFQSGNDFIGGLEFIFLGNMDQSSTQLSGGTIPDLEFMLFQMTFAMITGALVLGACAERLRFPVIVVFLAVWSVIVYAPMAHMVWGGGLFDDLPWGLTTLDFAGGTVVHICAGATGLGMIAYVGRRSENVSVRAHSVPMTFIGGMLLMFGWIGFNGGSGLAADGVAVNAVAVSVISMVFGMGAWGAVQYIKIGRVGALGLVAGAIQGLVAITPAAGYVSPQDSIFIGAVGGIVCYFGVSFMRSRSGVDDALDVMGVHGFGGIWGAIATGLFAYSSEGGLIHSGDWHLIAGQLIAVLFTLVFCFAVSYVLIRVIGRFMGGARVSESEETIGQDLVEHGEPAYVM